MKARPCVRARTLTNACEMRLAGLAEPAWSGTGRGGGGVINFLATHSRAHPNSICDSLFIHTAK